MSLQTGGLYLLGTLLTSFINIRGNLNSCVGIVDIILEVWVIHKLQLDVRGIFHLSFSIHGILHEQEDKHMKHKHISLPNINTVVESIQARSSKYKPNTVEPRIASNLTYE